MIIMQRYFSFNKKMKIYVSV